MNETADVATNLPAIVLISWWVAVSMLHFLFRSDEMDKTENFPADQPQDATEEPAYPELRQADPDFSAQAFLSGACRAYEEILHAYALCDLKALQPLLSNDVFLAFAEACRMRMTRGEMLELTLVGIQSAEIAGTDVGPDAMEITVLFRVHLIHTLRSAKDDLIEGDPAAVAAVSDLWTFARPRPLGKETWRLVATDEALQPA